MGTLAKTGPRAAEVPIVVVGIDFSDAGDLALRQAFAMANTTPSAEPHVVHVASAYGPMVRVDTSAAVDILTIEEASERVRGYVEQRLNDFRIQDGTRFERVVTHVRIGPPAQEIAQLAADLDADLVLVGTHGRRGVRHLLLGSVAESVMRLARCPVLIVRAKDHEGHALPDVPQIEPPCPLCLMARRQSAGQQMWCAQHSERHGRRHAYHYVSRNVASQENMPLIRQF